VREFAGVGADKSDQEVFQELLGHSQIAVTMDVYSHVLPTMQREVTAGLDKVLQALPLPGWGQNKSPGSISGSQGLISRLDFW
jgi:hypothetical protein